MQSRSRKGFTLVELLVVIAIIATLAAIAIPATVSVMRSAKITEGEKVAKDLVFAVESFEKDYQYLPFPGSSAPSTDTKFKLDSSGSDLLKVLMGSGDTTANTKGSSYFEYKQTDKQRKGIEYDASGAPVAIWDAFGNNFELMIDYDYDDEINSSPFQLTAPDSDSSSNIVRGVSALAASLGANGELNQPEWKEKYFIKTWR